MIFRTLLVVVAIISTGVWADAGRGEVRDRVEPKGFLYGIGLGINQEIYKGYDYRVIPLPIIGYRGENFRVLGPFVSYDVFEISDVELTLQAAPRFQGFDASDSYIFENMKERKFSMDAGLRIGYERNDWKIGLSSMIDILRRSNGYEAKANISRVFRKGPLFFEPSFSLSYLDRNHVDYYYGVKSNETNKFTDEYQGKSALNSTVALSLATPIFLGGFTRVVVDYTWYDSAIANSPLVEDKGSVSARLLYSKFF